MRRKRKQNSNVILAFLLIALIIYNFGITFSQKEEENSPQEVSTDLKVYFLDVGQADSILIQNNGHNMLIDAGNNEDGPLLVDYFKSLHIETFDYVIGTHPHEDHIGGLDSIIDNFEIKNLYMPDAITTTKTFEDVLDSAERNHVEITIPEIGEKFSLEEAKFDVIYTGTDTKDLNNTSIILKMLFGETSYLFTGDTTSKVESKILNQAIDVDVLKVGHHGSSYSSTEEFLSEITPKYAIISVGKGNSYKHPSIDTINRLKKYTQEIYRTDELGTILMTSNGKDITIINFNTNTNGE